MTRGYNRRATAVTTFAYDDFGRLLEVKTPEVGNPNRYEYDVADRLIRRRDGVGAAEVNTTVYSYDSLGRTTQVVHGAEHPVVCDDGSTAAGTSIQNEEYAYDRCAADDLPAGVACTNGLGRLTLSRAIEQCGTHGEVIKRGRWYSYDALGRVSQVAYATVTGATIGAPAVMTYSYDSAGQLQSYTSPVNAAFGTRYQYGASDGRSASITTTADPGSPIAHDPLRRRGPAEYDRV
jgi:YD repeat-containing protein